MDFPVGSQGTFVFFYSRGQVGRCQAVSVGRDRMVSVSGFGVCRSVPIIPGSCCKCRVQGMTTGSGNLCACGSSGIIELRDPSGCTVRTRTEWPKPIKDMSSIPWGLCNILESARYIFAHELIRTVFSDFSAE